MCTRERRLLSELQLYLTKTNKGISEVTGGRRGSARSRRQRGRRRSVKTETAVSVLGVRRRLLSTLTNIQTVLNNLPVLLF